jgi:hypothetical protein
MTAFYRAFMSTLRNFPAAVAIGWPLLVIYAAPFGVALLIWLMFGRILMDGAGSSPLILVPVVVAQLLAIALFCFAPFVAMSIAVNWHRYILRGDWPRGWKKLKIDRLVFRYLNGAILVGLRVLIVMIIPMLALNG